MRVHEAIVAVLKDVGVDVIFGGAGEESMGMQIAVAQAEGVRGIIPKHEQNASFMACGYALFSGKLGVCFSTAGPGAFNLLSGVCVGLNGSLPGTAASTCRISARIRETSRQPLRPGDETESVEP